ncbi:MAG: hypothetical protein H0T46_01825 [Deltaproteobacteria bacterium]|nr:hypothetical protein [Deltaproteobacteria bacterium]
MLRLAFVVLMSGCGEKAASGDSPERNTQKRKAERSTDEEILILEAARDKAKGELATMLAKDPPDTRAIDEKRAAIHAVENRLASLRKRSPR